MHEVLKIILLKRETERCEFENKGEKMRDPLARFFKPMKTDHCRCNHSCVPVEHACQYSCCVSEKEVATKGLSGVTHTRHVPVIAIQAIAKYE